MEIMRAFFSCPEAELTSVISISSRWAGKFVAASVSRTRAGTLERSNWIDERLTATASIARPLLALQAGLIQNLITDFDDQTHFFSDGNELGWENHSAFRMRPPQ